MLMCDVFYEYRLKEFLVSEELSAELSKSSFIGSVSQYY